jgi:hypothetical protein
MIPKQKRFFHFLGRTAPSARESSLPEVILKPYSSVQIKFTTAQQNVILKASEQRGKIEQTF